MRQPIDYTLAEQNNLCCKCENQPTNICFDSKISRKCWLGNYYIVVDCSDFVPIPNEYTNMKKAG